MRCATILGAVALVSAAACSNADIAGPQSQSLQPRFRIDETCTKTPGRTDETTANNPGGKQPPGQQGPDLTNRECKEAGGR